MALRIQIAKFKFHQYLQRANLQNLMLTKLSHYTVYIYYIIATATITLHVFNHVVNESVIEGDTVDSSS